MAWLSSTRRSVRTFLHTSVSCACAYAELNRHAELHSVPAEFVLCAVAARLFFCRERERERESVAILQRERERERERQGGPEGVPQRSPGGSWRWWSPWKHKQSVKNGWEKTQTHTQRQVASGLHLRGGLRLPAALRAAAAGAGAARSRTVVAQAAIFDDLALFATWQAALKWVFGHVSRAPPPVLALFALISCLFSTV